MKISPSQIAVISRTAGLRLRCFLGKMIFILAGAMLLSSASFAQPDAEGALHLSRIQGIVVDGHGKPVGAAKITLARGDKLAFESTTDAAGRFHFDHVSGQYRLHVTSLGNAGASREVVVGEALVALAHRNKIYVILGPGACTDDCSLVLASKSEFDHVISRNNGHNY